MHRLSKHWGAALLFAGLLTPAELGHPGVPPRSDPPAFSPDAAIEAAEKLPRLRSLLVSHHGELILERYFNGAHSKQAANIKSASKSVVSALVGIAIERGLIASVDTPVATFFPELRAAKADQRRQQITIEDLLTMRSGLEPTSNRNYGRWIASPNWVRYILNRPMVSAPGFGMHYSTGNTHLLSAILTKTSGGSTWNFANKALAKPLGMTLARWPRDPQGIYFGGNDMEMTPRQMMAFGELYANHGRVNGQQVLPTEWIEASLVPRTRSRWSERLYGYGWWIRELAGLPAFYAWGYGGQFIFVVPDLELVVVTTSSANPGSERGSHRRALDALVEEQVVAPIALSSGIT
jgi:CubicO group peptidase (beta-lactamase class C family)